MPSLEETYLQSVISRFAGYKELADKTFVQLEESDFHFSPNEASNSIAIIIQHVAGNMLSRWTNFLTEDGEKEWRDRDGEFDVHSYGRMQLLEIWEKGWKCMFDALQSLKSGDLLKIIYIRKEALTAIDAINRQLAHYPYHIGQILYIGKIIKGDDWKNLSVPKKK
jgi:hypothetical protein